MDKDGQTTDTGGITLRRIAYITLILFLVVATVAVAAGSFLAVSALLGVRAVAQPVGDLVRDLVVEATPVIVPNPAIVVEEINSLARLETAEFAFQDVITIERNQDLLFGVFGEELLFVAYGNVIAGVDLQKMSPDDIQVVSPSQVIVHLPEPELLVTSLDNERSYVANRERGFLANADPQLETLVRQEAETRMVEAALNNGILQRADTEARLFMELFLGEFGFSTITFVEDTPPVVTPIIPEVPKGFVVTPPAAISPTP
ncbi:MAG: DUF4230 domain-containing protein [Candidatus Promineifilaceae bacterium]|nr:DUF4230 domain-containing protein [Candidatus Promineifilaceae bacterium]